MRAEGMMLIHFSFFTYVSIRSTHTTYDPIIHLQRLFFQKKVDRISWVYPLPVSPDGLPSLADLAQIKIPKPAKMAYKSRITQVLVHGKEMVRCQSVLQANRKKLCCLRFSCLLTHRHRLLSHLIPQYSASIPSMLPAVNLELEHDLRLPHFPSPVQTRRPSLVNHWNRRHNWRNASSRRKLARARRREAFDTVWSAFVLSMCASQRFSRRFLLRMASLSTVTSSRK
ncbi:hypothetical protein BT96DRAFT_615653 [Gymnopus androsaceus JB14]|uniref:Uncharacterized protein n=1 Tax=Gymnopus androsaceus JB14 TaxID=1447944 RepID=A0A6A4GH30_9AGAR|nr:hypothetical protein BT96DRAFT_615653 [Gymnopus androsaceus JB14]